MLLLPIPDEEGIKKTKELLKDKYSKEITDEEAHRLLGGVMKYLFLLQELTNDDPTNVEGKEM